MPYTGSEIVMTFHRTMPRVDHAGSTYWLELEAEPLKATVFLTQDEAQRLAANLIAVAGALPQPEAAITPSAMTDAPDRVFTGDLPEQEEALRG